MYINSEGFVVLSDVRPVYHNDEVGFYNTVVTMRDIAEIFPALEYDGEAQRGIIDGSPVVIESHVKEISQAILNGEPIRGQLTWNVRNEEDSIINYSKLLTEVKGKITVPDSWHRHCAIRRVFELDQNNEVLDNEVVLNIYNLTKEDEIELFVDINSKGKAPNKNRVTYLSDSKTAQFTRDLVNNSNLKNRVECVNQVAMHGNITKFSNIHDALFSANGVYKKASIESDKDYNSLLEYLVKFVDILLESRREFNFTTTEERRELKKDTMILEEISWYAYFQMAKEIQESSFTNWREALMGRMNKKYREPSGKTIDFWSKENYIFASVVKYIVSPTEKKPIPTSSCINSNATRRAMQTIVSVHLFS